ncbi:MAG: xanthine dehydrogenase family protein molybdopterin-binding subunit [Acidimicrobiia bacterium]|nr:xanthine dehydrogenase family protein molybdopterin-binding subunit [Acidimicrobiia bacterium]
MTATETRVVGKRLPKLDAPDKVSGRIQYADDLHIPGMLTGAILRSPHAHARIVSIDVSKAEALPGVKAVIHAGNVQQRPFGYGHDNLPLKDRKVRCVGDEVAAVAAIDEATAKRALGLIDVVYEVLPAVVDPLEALEDGAPLIHDERLDIDGNVSMRWDFETGDVDKAAEEAAVIVEGTYSSPLAAPGAIETHVVIASFDRSGHLTVWSPVHMVFMYRKELADTLGLDWGNITIKQPPVGGSFGGKIDIDTHDFICVLLAEAAQRPVKLAMSREEEFIGTRTRQPIHFKLRTGADADGNILFRDTQVISDNGAYNAWGSHAMLVAMNTVTSLYRVPNSRMRCAVVYTNKSYGGSVRGFGNPQSTFAVEQQLEEIADALGRDPMELRIQNANQAGDVTPQGLKITTCGLTQCLESVKEASGWNERRGKMKDRYRGLGAAAFIHVGGGARIYGSDGCGAMIKMDDSGQISLISGSSELGQGSETALAMIVAEEVGVPMSKVRVIHSDTDVKPWDVGVHASRTTFVAGNAARLAAGRARDKLLAAAAEVLGKDDLVIEDGVISSRSEPERAMPYDKAIRRLLLREEGNVIMSTAFYDPPTENQDKGYIGNISATYGFGAHVAEVEVDPGTGQVKLLNLWTAHDVGRAINPSAVEGQIEGGAVMGIGLALTEELPVRVEVGELMAPNLHDYGLPTMVDAPRIHVDLIETNDPLGPFGAKGIGEGGLIPVPAAVANAVADAVGIRPRQFPLRPWKVLDWIQTGETSNVVKGAGRG